MFFLALAGPFNLVVSSPASFPPGSQVTRPPLFGLPCSIMASLCLYFCSGISSVPSSHTVSCGSQMDLHLLSFGQCLLLCSCDSASGLHQPSCSGTLCPHLPSCGGILTSHWVLPCVQGANASGSVVLAVSALPVGLILVVPLARAGAMPMTSNTPSYSCVSMPEGSISSASTSTTVPASPKVAMALGITGILPK